MRIMGYGDVTLIFFTKETRVQVIREYHYKPDLDATTHKHIRFANRVSNLDKDPTQVS